MKREECEQSAGDVPANAGRTAGTLGLLRAHMSTFPDHWQSFMAQHSPPGHQVAIPEQDDVSGVGAEFEILDQKQADSEATEFYPGIAAQSQGYIPVGSCVLGTGDPYFIKESDPPPGPLYRIYHDSCDASGLQEGAVDIVLNSYTDIAKYTQT